MNEVAHHGPHLDHGMINRFGVWLFIISEAMFFVALIGVRISFAGTGHPAQLSQGLAAGLTALLIVSLVTAHQGLRAYALGKANGAGWLAATLVLGLLFMAGAIEEWQAVGLAVASRFGTIFYTAMGFDLVHVIIGVGVLISLLLRGRKGQFAEGRYGSVELGVLYWYFVVVVWLVMYPVLYLM